MREAKGPRDSTPAGGYVGLFQNTISMQAAPKPSFPLRRCRLRLLPRAGWFPSHRIGLLPARLFDCRHQKTDEQRSDCIES